MNDDLVLLLDEEEDIVLEDDQGDDLILEDADPYRQEYDEYTGPTVFTPGRQAQIVLTARKVVLTDIRINPIPQNYGLVSYDGSVITIS